MIRESRRNCNFTGLAGASGTLKSDMDEQLSLSFTTPHSSVLFEKPEELYSRVFREVKPRTPVPAIRVVFRRYANANSSIRLAAGSIEVSISDLLEGAPAPVMEALAHILVRKLFRRSVPRAYTNRYRLYLNRRDIRHKLHLLRQIRGRKFLSGAQGRHYDLAGLFEDLNSRFFDGLLARPLLGWSLRPSRTRLGHFDPSHNAVIISSIFDSEAAPRLALEYVLFHEMLHLRFPVDHSGARRRVHTREFRDAERQFPDLQRAKEMLKHLP